MLWARTRTVVSAREEYERATCVIPRRRWRTTMHTGKFVSLRCFGAILGMLAGPALADGNRGCSAIPNLGSLKSALSGSITASAGTNGGLGFNMWGVIVDTSGIVCAVAFSGADF